MKKIKCKLSDGNRFYENKKYADAAKIFQLCLSYWNSLGNAPASLVKITEARLDECLNKIELPTDNLSAKDISIVLRSKFTTLSSERKDICSSYSLMPFKKYAAVSPLPKVSIIIPHFNSKDLIYDALDSIKKQSFHEIETLIVDDCSTDLTIKNSRLVEYPSWMRIRVLTMKENSGPSTCRNQGILKSKGRAICFLDADDLFEGDTLKNRWEMLNSYPMIGGSFSAMRLVDKNNKFLGKKILDYASQFSSTDFVSNKFPCSALMIRKSILQVDMFDENTVYGEDYECFSRIAQRGWMYHFSPKGTIAYRQHGASITHKDVISDLESRAGITKYVHQRELKWSHTKYSLTTLPNAIVASEVTHRSFPVVCVFALCGELTKAHQLSQYIDPDIVSTRSPSQLVGAIRFFLVREKYISDGDVDKFLNTSNKVVLCEVLSSFFHYRHREFVVRFVKTLFPDFNYGEHLHDIIHPQITSMSWGNFLSSDDSKWSGYLLLHRPEESAPNNSIKAIRRFLQQRADLEGVFALRFIVKNEQLYTDISSVAPEDPDSTALNELGEKLIPPLVIHEVSARTLKYYLLEKNRVLKKNDNKFLIEKQVLKAVITLRLKVVGGFTGAYVIKNKG